MNRNAFTDTTLTHYKIIAGDVNTTPLPIKGESSNTPLPIVGAVTMFNPFLRYVRGKNEPSQPRLDVQRPSKDADADLEV